MPRRQSETPRTDRIELRTSPAEKALLLRAATIERLDLTTFVLRAALPEAENVIAAAERVVLTERDSLRVLELLENPPPPPPRLLAAARRRLRRP
ncbi:MAG TPA: DUF1778 domain-containing protein [Xanthobacteraceae bacterium]|jgi:uncharacterized protein (DUF1778 family)